MNIKEYQKLACEITDELDKKFDVKRDPQLSVSQLIEELGELAREINSEKLRNKKSAKEDLEQEFADVFLQLAKLADFFNIDLEKAILDKIKILKKRHDLK